MVMVRLRWFTYFFTNMMYTLPRPQPTCSLKYLSNVPDGDECTNGGQVQVCSHTGGWSYQQQYGIMMANGPKVMDFQQLTQSSTYHMVYVFTLIHITMVDLQHEYKQRRGILGALVRFTRL